jgi:WD40 repeat protein
MRFSKRWLTVCALVAVPSVLYLCIAERLSWMPRTFTAGGPVNALAFSPDGNLVAIGRYRYVTLKKIAEEEIMENRGQLEVWDVSSKQPFLWFAHNVSDPLDRLNFLPDGKDLFYVNNGGRVQRMNLTTKHIQQIPNIRCQDYNGFAVAPNGQEIAVVDRNQIRFYDSRSGQLSQVIRNPPRSRDQDGKMDFIQYSGDGKILCARVEYGSSFDLWEVATGKKVCTVRTNSGSQEEGRLSPDGKTLALGSSQRIRLFDVPTRKWRASLLVGADSIFALCWSNDNQQVAVGNMSGKLMLFDAHDGKLLKSWQGNKNYPIDTVAFSPDSRVLASAPSYPDGITLRRVR